MFTTDILTYLPNEIIVKILDDADIPTIINFCSINKQYLDICLYVIESNKWSSRDKIIIYLNVINKLRFDYSLLIENVYPLLLNDKYFIEKYKKLGFEDFDINNAYNLINNILSIDKIQLTRNHIYFINLKSLTINNGTFNMGINILPSGLTSLTINSNTFNMSIDNLPSSLKLLYIGGLNFDQHIDQLPSSLRSLMIIGGFNQKIDNLPSELKSLTIYCSYFRNFNQSVDNLPSGLKSLTIQSNMFDQSVDNLSLELKSLTIYCRYFNQSVDNLPSCLQSLTIKSSIFNKSVDNLPNSLKSLYINSIFNKYIRKFPSNLENLSLLTNCKSLAYIPYSIKHLEITDILCIIYINRVNNLNKLKSIICHSFSTYKNNKNNIRKKIKLFKVFKYKEDWRDYMFNYEGKENICDMCWMVDCSTSCIRHNIDDYFNRLDYM